MGAKGSDTIDNKKRMLENLEVSKGIVTSAAASTGISRDSHYEWLKADPDYKKAVESIQESCIDFVESKLLQKIKGITMAGKDEDDPTYDLPPSDTAIIFYLKTKAKKRGYIERTEIEHSGKVDVSLDMNEDNE